LRSFLTEVTNWEEKLYIDAVCLEIALRQYLKITLYAKEYG